MTGMAGIEPIPDYPGLPLDRFLDMVACREPAPGGGASAAVTVALAAALAAMAARFSTEQLAEAETLAAKAEEARGRALPLARDDAAAYGRVLNAYRTPRDDEEGRRRTIRQALSEAADVPLSIAEIGAEVTGLSARLAVEGNPNLKGDAVAAATLAAAGARAAVALVEINILAAGADDDHRLSRARELLAATAASQDLVEKAGARGTS